MHGVQAVSPPLLLHRFAQLRLIGQLLGSLDDLLLQRESALQVSQEGVLVSSAETAGITTALSRARKTSYKTVTSLLPQLCCYKIECQSERPENRLE